MGGGQGSGSIQYPDYIENIHHDMLDGSVAGAWIQPAVNWYSWLLDTYTNPYNYVNAYNPTTDLATILQAINQAEIDNYVLADSDWRRATIAPVATQQDIQDFVDDLVVYHNDAMDREVMPQFEAGYRDINAVQNASFVKGKADIVARVQKEAFREIALFWWDTFYGQLYNQRLEIALRAKSINDDTWHKIMLAKMDHGRLSLDSWHRQYVHSAEISHRKIYYYGDQLRMLFSLIGAPAGSGYVPGGPSEAAATVGGAFSGAATGAQVGGWKGAIIGGVIGGAAGYLSTR